MVINKEIIKIQIKVWSRAVLALTLYGLSLSVMAAPTAHQRMPAIVAKQGFSLELANTVESRFSLAEILKAEDTVLYSFLHMSH